MLVNEKGDILAWKNIEVQVTLKSRSIFKKDNVKKIILDKVSGEARSGKLLAVVGSSGSGKTTLLEALSRTINKRYSVKGIITVNGKDGKKILRNNSSFLKQYKKLIPQMTVKEYLWYQFSLRVPKNKLGNMDLNDSVASLLEEIGLLHVQNTKIGENGITKTLSGGEMRRLIFASEILGDTKFLFLDEPTTGLDGFAAKECVSILKKLVKNRNICAICSIHQPSSTVLNYLDEILLLTPLGRVAYQGKIPLALRFFEERFGLRCPNGFNPCDFLLKHTSYCNENEVATKDRVEMICDEYQNLINSFETTVKTMEQENYYEKMKCFTPTFNQIRVLTWKELLLTFRSPKYMFKNSYRSLALALSMSCLFWNQQLTDIGAKNLVGAVGEVARTLGSQFSIISGFGFDEAVIISDHKARLYNISSYMITKTIIDALYCAFDTLILTSIIYWSIGLQETFEKHVFFVVVLFLSNFAGSAAGDLLRSLFPGIRAFNVTASLFFNYQRVVTGYSIKFSSFPWYISWTKYLFPVFYAVESIMVNQWSDVQAIKCEASDSSTCFKNGRDILKQYSYEENVYRDITCILTLIIVTKCLVYLILLFKVKSK